MVQRLKLDDSMWRWVRSGSAGIGWLKVPSSEFQVVNILVEVCLKREVLY